MTKHDNVSQGKIMKATEFVKRRGVSDARRILKDSEGCASVKLYGKYEFSTDDLKRLVESHELVNEFFNLEALGFDKAIELAKKQIEELEDNETVEFWHRWDDDLSCTVARMKQAIADVEACQ